MQRPVLRCRRDVYAERLLVRRRRRVRRRAHVREQHHDAGSVRLDLLRRADALPDLIGEREGTGTGLVCGAATEPVDN